MKRFTLFISSVFIVGFSFSAQGQNWLWTKSSTLGGVVSSVSADTNGNVFATGYFWAPTITFGSFTLTNSLGNNVFIVKYDASGNVLWANNAIGSSNAAEANNAQGHSVSTDANGNVYVTGYFGSSIITFGSITLTNAGPFGSNYDVFLVKYDSNGNVLWATNAGGTNSGDIDEGNCVNTDASGNVFVTGYFSGTITFGTITLTSGTVFLAKYDANGNVLWAKSAGSQSDKGIGVCADQNGNAFITGVFKNPTITFGSTILPNTGADDVFLVKYDANGNVLWAKSAEGADADAGYSVSTDVSGNVFVTGGFQGNTINFGSIILITSSPTFPSMFIAKYDANGNVLWAKNAGGFGGGTIGYGASTDTSGNVFVTGCFASTSITFDFITHNNWSGWSSIFIAKYDASGNVLCASVLPIREAYGVSTDVFGNAYIGGAEGDVITGKSAFVAKYSCNNFPLDISQTNPLCNGQCTGTATAIPLGGISPYTYNWSDGQTTQIITGLCSGWIFQTT